MENKEEILDYIKTNIRNEDLDEIDFEYEGKLFNPYTAFMICGSFDPKDKVFVNTFTNAVYEYIKAAKAYACFSSGFGKSMCDQRGVKVEDLDTYKKCLENVFDIGEKLGLEDEEDMGLYAEAVSYQSKTMWKQLPSMFRTVLEERVVSDVRKELSRIK